MVILFLICIFAFFYLGQDSKETKDKPKNSDASISFTKDSFKELFEKDKKETDFITREEFIILLSRTATKDEIQTLYEDLNESLVPVELRSVENKKYYLYFTQMYVKTETLYNYTFKNNKKKDTLKREEMLSLLAHTIKKEESYVSLKRGTVSAPAVKSIFKNEIEEILSYEKYRYYFLEKDTFKEKVTINEALEVTEILFNHLNKEIYKKSESKKETFKKGEYNDPKTHNHPISEDEYFLAKHEILHALMNYQEKYKEIPLKPDNIPPLSDELMNELQSYSYNISDFKVLDVNALYPEFISERFDKDMVIVNIKHNSIFFVNGFIDEKTKQKQY